VYASLFVDVCSGSREELGVPKISAPSPSPLNSVRIWRIQELLAARTFGRKADIDESIQSAELVA
jgi:hypothetical protein